MSMTSPGTSTRPVTARPSISRWWVLAIVALAQLMVVLDSTIVNIALPSAQRDLGFSDANRQWIVTAYSLAFGSLLLLSGKLSDIVGRKRMFLTGLIGFAVMSAIGGAAPNFGLLVAARALQGACGAMLAPAALSLLTTTFTIPKERGRAFAVFGSIAGAGGAVGLLLGGFLTEYFDWRWCLYVNVLIAAVAVIGAIIILPVHVKSTVTTHIDAFGTALVSFGLFCIVYGFSNAASDSWGSVLTWGPLAVGVLLIVAFVWREAHSEDPLLPLEILKDRDRGAGFISIFIIGCGMFGVFLFLTYYLQDILGFKPVQSGLAFLPFIAIMITMSILGNTILVTKVGAKILVPTGMFLVACSGIILTRLQVDSSYGAHVLPGLILAGLGMGCVMSPSISMATRGVIRDHAGVASATVNVCQQVGGSVGISLLSTIAVTAAADFVAGTAQPSAQAVAAMAQSQGVSIDEIVKQLTEQVTLQAQLHSYTVAFAWTASFFVVGGIIAAFLFRRKGSALQVSMPEAVAAPAV